MNDKTDSTTVFFGKMAANLTHEIKNILAIIQESAGLMEDILAICPLAEEKFQQKFNNSLATIKAQLQRGMELSSQFNRFAHLPDHDRTEADLDETVSQFCTLSGRFARLKHVNLSAGDSPNGAIWVTANPIRLFMALFLCMEACLEALPEHSTIEMAPCQKDQSPAVQMTCAGPGSLTANGFFEDLKKSPAWTSLEDTVNELEARLVCETDAHCFWLVF